MPKEKRHIYINSDYVDRFIGRHGRNVLNLRKTYKCIIDGPDDLGRTNGIHWNYIVVYTADKTGRGKVDFEGVLAEIAAHIGVANVAIPGAPGSGRRIVMLEIKQPVLRLTVKSSWLGYLIGNDGSTISRFQKDYKCCGNGTEHEPHEIDGCSWNLVEFRAIIRRGESRLNAVRLLRELLTEIQVHLSEDNLKWEIDITGIYEELKDGTVSWEQSVGKSQAPLPPPQVTKKPTQISGQCIIRIPSLVNPARQEFRHFCVRKDVVEWIIDDERKILFALEDIHHCRIFGPKEENSFRADGFAWAWFDVRLKPYQDNEPGSGAGRIRKLVGDVEGIVIASCEERVEDADEEDEQLIALADKKKEDEINAKLKIHCGAGIKLDTEKMANAKPADTKENVPAIRSSINDKATHVSAKSHPEKPALIPNITKPLFNAQPDPAEKADFYNAGQNFNLSKFPPLSPQLIPPQPVAAQPIAPQLIVTQFIAPQVVKPSSYTHQLAQLMPDLPTPPASMDVQFIAKNIPPAPESTISYYTAPQLPPTQQPQEESSTPDPETPASKRKKLQEEAEALQVILRKTEKKNLKEKMEMDEKILRVRVQLRASERERERLQRELEGLRRGAS